MAITSDYGEVYAVPGENSIIDTINVTTGLTSVFAETEEQVKVRYPNAVRMAWEAWRAAAIARQQTPIIWTQIKARAELSARAEAAPSGVLIEHSPEWNGWCRVTFAEKPERDILNALRTAGFRWGAGHWGGYFEKLPEVVKALTV